MKINVTNILLACIVVVLILSRVTSCGGTTDLKEQTALYDTISKLKSIITDKDRQIYDERVAHLNEKDSILQTRDKTLIIKHENIPSIIRAITNNDSLRAAGKRAEQN